MVLLGAVAWVGVVLQAAGGGGWLPPAPVIAVGLQEDAICNAMPKPYGFQIPSDRPQTPIAPGLAWNIFRGNFQDPPRHG